MSVYQPIDDVTDDFGKLVSVEMFKALAENINYLIDSMPVGTIIPILYGLPGVPVPDPTIWQECDGSLVANENSPIHGQHVPDHTQNGGLYLKGANTSGESGLTDGTHLKNLQHSHGGQTEPYTPPTNVDSDDDYFAGAEHTHSISTDLQTNHNFDPAHIKIKHYIKIL